MLGTKRARRLRTWQTDLERRLWARLRNRQLLGCKFRRQVPTGFYIVDFACREAGLIVELAGGQHCESREDAARDADLRQAGWRVLRVSNTDAYEKMEGELATVAEALRQEEAFPHPVPLPQAGEGTLAARSVPHD
jgi:very-short-patch-repair endonuclease